MNVKKSRVIELRVDFQEGSDQSVLKQRMSGMVGIANRVNTSDKEGCFIARFRYPKTAKKAEEKIREVIEREKHRASIGIRLID